MEKRAAVTGGSKGETRPDAGAAQSMSAPLRNRPKCCAAANRRDVPLGDIGPDQKGGTPWVPRSNHLYFPEGDCIALSICSFTASRLKLAPFCIGGKSIAVCASLPTSCCTSTKRQNS